MKALRVLAAFAGLTLVGCGNNAIDEAKVLSTKTFQADDLNVVIKEVETPEAVRASVVSKLQEGIAGVDPMTMHADGDDVASPLDQVDVMFDQILNMGKKMWAVIEAGKPVMNVKFDFANALPKGIKVASDLNGFSELQFKSYEYSATNFYGIEVFRVQYTVVYQYGGSFSGKGAYIASASVVPQDVSVLWGYSLNMKVDNVSVTNIGSSESPVAGMNLLAHVKVSTVLKATEINEIFTIRGDNGALARIK